MVLASFQCSLHLRSCVKRAGEIPWVQEEGCGCYLYSKVLGEKDWGWGQAKGAGLDVCWGLFWLSHFQGF